MELSAKKDRDGPFSDAESLLVYGITMVDHFMQKQTFTYVSQNYEREESYNANR